MYGQDDILAVHTKNKLHIDAFTFFAGDQLVEKWFGDGGLAFVPATMVAFLIGSDDDQAADSA